MGNVMKCQNTGRIPCKSSLANTNPTSYFLWEIKPIQCFFLCCFFFSCTKATIYGYDLYHLELYLYHDWSVVGGRLDSVKIMFYYDFCAYSFFCISVERLPFLHLQSAAIPFNLQRQLVLTGATDYNSVR